MKKIFAFSTVFLLLSVGFIFAQRTTGMIEGVITDEEGTVLPGVMVTVTGPNIAARSVTTNMNGVYRFPALPPGEYAVSASLPGFKKFKEEGVVVRLEATKTVNIILEVGAIEEEITVIGESPVVDMTSSRLTTNVKKEYFDSLPKGRTYQDMVYLAPSVQQDRWGIGVAGATGAENLYIIDGINTTDVEDGVVGTDLAYEFIEEVQTKTGGYEAEFAGALGGVVNVITKSGGNELHGGMVFNYQNDAFYGEPKIGIRGDGAVDEFSYYDFGLNLSGPIVKDSIWFFFGATPGFRTTHYKPTNEYTGETRTFDVKRNTYYFSGKFTIQAAPGHTITASVFGDPRKGEGFNPGTRRDFDDYLEYVVEDYTGGTYNFVFKYDGVIGSDWLVHALGGLYYDKTREIPKNLDKPAVIYELGYAGAPSAYYTGGRGWYCDPELRKRWQGGFDITHYWGGHAIKAGVQFQRSQSLREDYYTGGYYRQIVGDYYFRDRWRSTAGMSYTDVLGIFIQDSWKVTDRLTVNLGVRLEDQNIHASDEARHFEPHESVIHWKLWEQFSPRVGFTYDVLGDGTSKLFGSYGRFFEMVPLDINSRQFGAEFDIMYYYDITQFDPLTDFYPSLNLTTDPYRIRDIGHEPSDFPDTTAANKGLDPQYMEEFILGFEKQFMADWSLSVRGIWKRLGMIVEDGSFDGGSTYFIFNPGKHFVPGEINDLTGEPRVEFIDAFPKAERNYYALEIMLNKRFSNNYQFTISYTLSQLKGNFAGLAWHEYGQLDPNITANYDFPEFMYNADGKLPNHMPHQFKFDGVYMFPGALEGLALGASFRYHTGQPLTKMGLNQYYSITTNHPVCFLEKRGETDQLPDYYQLDLHLGYDLRLAEKYKVGFTLDAMNVFNTKIETRRYMVIVQNQFFGLPDPQDFWNYPIPTEPDNPDYGKGLLYHDPIRVRLGIVFSF